jgi:hypothetical protein
VAYHAELLAHLTDKRGILSTLFSEAVVNVTRLDMDIEEPSYLEEPVQEYR